MTQSELNREIASQTGETIQTIKSLGFSPLRESIPIEKRQSRSWSIGMKLTEKETGDEFVEQTSKKSHLVSRCRWSSNRDRHIILVRMCFGVVTTT